MEDCKDFLVDYIDNTDIKYGLNSTEILVIPIDLSELISRFEEVTKKITKFKTVSIFKKNDKIGLIIEFLNIKRFMTINFMNIENNIYEFYVIVI